MIEGFRTQTQPSVVSVLVLHPKFRLFSQALKQGIFAAHMLWVNIAQKTNMSRKSHPICQQFAYFNLVNFRRRFYSA